jgi:hypothetical protein
MNQMDVLDDRVEALLGQSSIEFASRPGRVKLLKSEHAVLLVSSFVHDGRGFCRIAALLLSDVEPSLELIQRILHANADLVLGSIQLFEDRVLALVITLPESALEADTFEWTVRYAAWQADALVSVLSSAARGRTSAELLGRQPPCG